MPGTLLAEDLPVVVDDQVVARTWTTDSIRPYVEAAIEAFGVERSMFASNFPVDKLFSSYDAILNASKEITVSVHRVGGESDVGEVAIGMCG